MLADKVGNYVIVHRGVLIDTDRPWRGYLRLRKRADQSEDSAPADGHPEDAGQAGAGPACQGEADRGQGGAKTLGPLAVSAGQAGYLLDEGTPSACDVLTGEPTDPQPEYNASSSTGRISGKPQVGAVNPAGPRPAPWAGGARRSALSVNAHYLDIHVHRHHRDVRDRREQQLLRRSAISSHGPELSAQPPCPRLVFG